MSDPPYPAPDDRYALVFDAPDQATAQVVCATLTAAGLDPLLQNQYGAPGSGWMTHLSFGWALGVLVPEAQADEARRILAEQAPTEEELLAASQQASDSEGLAG